MIKKIVLASTLLVALSAPAFAASATGECAIKKQNIQRQIDYARSHGNSYRVAGLEKSLAEVNRYCTDRGVYAKRQEKMENRRHDVRKRELELQRARETGNSKKIGKAASKLDRAQSRLESARRATTRH